MNYADIRCKHGILTHACAICTGERMKVRIGDAWLDMPIDCAPAEPTTTRAVFPLGADARKKIPIATGCLDFFPDALAAVAALSYAGTEQHHPGKPLHWDRAKSTDEADCLMRHFMERGTDDTDGQRHSAKVAWRALALLQKEIEADRKF